jgi:DUF1680 family protein
MIPNPLTRRTFLKSAAAATALANAPLLASAPPRELLQQLPYSAVTLTGGPFKEHYDRIHAHYLALSNDRLLKVYRQRAGLPSPGADMGGWYDLDGFVPGHTLGQYISGLARIGASTGDGACHDKVRELVAGFAATLGPDNQSILRPKTNLWTCYTLDKHFAGLIDAATLSKVKDAPDLLNRVLAGSQALLPAQGRDRIGKKDPPYDETYVMPENLFTAAELTGNPAFSDLARRYLLDKELFNPLANGDDPFPGQHAYSHAIALSSGAKAYLTLGDTRYLKALQNAFTLLTTTQQFASGGWGPNETFVTPHKGELCASLSSTVDHFETPCGAYAATKLARYLLRFTADPRYGDNLERVLYNTILAARHPDSDGDYPYYSTYSPTATKVFYQRKWPCCSGTLVQTVADYVLNLYFQSPDGLFVNLYTPSTATVTHRGVAVTIAQRTQFPASERIVFTVDPAMRIDFNLTLRIPTWTTRPTLVLNGQPYPIKPGPIASIHRAWAPGDTLELTLPQTFRTEPIDDRNPSVVALVRGPVEYVALNFTGDKPNPLNQPRPTLNRDLKPSSSQTYTSANQIFVPLHTIQSETYDTYFNL